MTAAPTSVTLTSIAQSNVASFSATNITTAGFTFSVVENANGTGGITASYATAGN
jgi:hypothetical protein